MDPGMGINNFPAIVFASVIEYLVLTVGIYKAVRLRLVNSELNFPLASIVISIDI